MSLRKGLILSLLAITLVCLPVVIHKAPRIIYRTSQAVKIVQKTIKFDLNPGTTVRVEEGVISQPLTKLRSSKVSGPLKVYLNNPRYFSDETGQPILLTGSHTWSNLQDNGGSNPPPKFDYQSYLDFLQANNHNFFRLWTWEQPRWSLDSPNDNYWFSPMPYQRVGQERATDGLPKFDLTQFNQPYFDRIRERLIEAEKRGIYVSVMLFNGWSVAANKGVPGGKNPWQSHPFNRANNINGINGDLNGDQSGEEVHELAIPEITAIQEVYVRKIIDTVGDLDNVLYEISNESEGGSTQWQYHMINFIKSYEAGKPKQHPVGMTFAHPNGENTDLLASPADWISLHHYINEPPLAEGHKVILADTDHLCGVCGDRTWVWKSFTQGENPIFMDVYDGGFDLIVEHVPDEPLKHEPWVSIRRNLGYALTYANRLNLAAMIPHPELASSSYCLANPATSKAEYLIYSPSGGTVIVNLSQTPGKLLVEWLNPSNGITTIGIATTGGGNRSFVPPFEGDAVLYIHQESKEK